MKRCITCKDDKPLTEYHKESKSKDGCRNQCKACRKLRDKERWAQPKVTVTEKRCSMCKVIQHACNFNYSWQSRDGLMSRCSGCDAAYQRERLQQCPQKHRDYDRRYKYRMHYGITIEDYNALLKAQQGQCAICGTNGAGAGCKNFNVDHDHLTGQVRGLLCNQCNLAIGLFKDDPVLTKMATDYLLTHKNQTLHGRNNEDTDDDCVAFYNQPDRSG